MADAFGYWLAGFIDGEGCFVINEMRPTPSRVKYNCVFRLNVRDDDADIIYEIQEAVRFGKVRTFAKVDGHPQIGWHVDTKPECLALVALLEAYPLRAKKARDFDIWSEAVRAWRTVSAGQRSDWTRMAYLRHLLNDTRLYREAA